MDRPPGSTTDKRRRELRGTFAGIGVVLLLIATAMLAGGWDRCTLIPEAVTSRHMAWAVGEVGTIAHTANGGAAWAAQNSGTTAFLHGVDFADASNGWVVGAGGTILHTTDGGAIWNKQTSGVTSTLRGVDFVDSAHGWIVGDSDVVLATSDGGATWTPQTSTTSGYSFFGVSFADTDHGCIVGAGGFPNVVAVTADGGRTWRTAPSGADSLNAVGFAGASLVRAVGGGGKIVASPDRGASWSAQSSGTVANLESVDVAPDGLTGVAVGAIYGSTATPVILRTADAGATWVRVGSYPVTDQAQHAVSFADDQWCWAVGDYGTISASTDGGKTFTADTPVSPKGLWGVCAVLGPEPRPQPAVVEPGAKREPRSAANLDDLVLTWENGMTTIVYGVQNPQVAGEATQLVKTSASLPAKTGAKPLFGFTVTTALVFDHAAVTIPATALPAMGVPEKSASKLVAFRLASGGGATELTGAYDAATRTSTFAAPDLASTFVLATDTMKPVAKALRNAKAKRGAAVRLPFKITDGRPTVTVTIIVAKGKRVKAKVQLTAQPTNQDLKATLTGKLKPGTYSWTVKAVDRLGNRSAVTKASKKTLVVKR